MPGINGNAFVLFYFILFHASLNDMLKGNCRMLF